MNFLIINHDKVSRDACCLMLEREGHYAQPSGSGENAMAILKKDEFDAVFLELSPSDENGMAVLDKIIKEFPNLPVILLTDMGTVQVAVKAMRHGASDFLERPFNLDQLRPLLARMERLIRMSRQSEKLQAEVKETTALNPELLMDFSAPEMCAVLEVVLRAAKSHASILITGESGTGKSVLARAIHQQSHLAEKPFVTVSCPSLSKELLESELFGHAKGSFTGAVNDHWGKVKAADGGTLFLDEVGDLPLEIQPKLLRLLQEREYERLGETVTRGADIRIIAATHRDLKKQVLEGTFRADLYYRLNVITVNMPPLRERRADLIRLANHYVKHFSKLSRVELPQLSSSATNRLVDYSWPGNLRELRNAIERAVTMVRGKELTADDLPKEITEDSTNGEEKLQPGSLISLEQIQELHIQRVVERTATITEAARVLGIDQATIYRKRKKFAPSLTVMDRDCMSVG